VPRDGQVAVLVLAAAAAAELELRPHLVEGPAVLDGDGVRRHVDVDLEVQPVAALPVLDLEYRPVGQDIGQVEVRAVADRREANVEAPVAADALPEAPPEVRLSDYSAFKTLR